MLHESNVLISCQETHLLLLYSWVLAKTLAQLRLLSMARAWACSGFHLHLDRHARSGLIYTVHNKP
jgi:hypothetical protein